MVRSLSLEIPPGPEHSVLRNTVQRLEESLSTIEAGIYAGLAPCTFHWNDTLGPAAPDEGAAMAPADGITMLRPGFIRGVTLGVTGGGTTEFYVMIDGKMVTNTNRFEVAAEDKRGVAKYPAMTCSDHWNVSYAAGAVITVTPNTPSGGEYDAPTSASVTVWCEMDKERAV